jgi:hypothetical protein
MCFTTPLGMVAITSATGTVVRRKKSLAARSTAAELLRPALILGNTTAASASASNRGTRPRVVLA